MKIHSSVRARLTAVGACVLFLGGCASFSPDGGLNDVSRLTQTRTGVAVQLSKGAPTDDERAKIGALLGQPLTPDSAVQIALLNNRDLKVALAELGVAEADFVESGRLSNPGVSFSRVSGGSVTEVDRGISFNIASLIALPMRLGIERNRFEQGKLAAALQATTIAGETRRAFFEAVAAQQTAEFMEQVNQSAQASAELASRMKAVGNWSKLDQAREQVYYAETMAQLARARLDVTTTRERLAQLLGLDDNQLAFPLPTRLPDLPKAPREVGSAEAQAFSQRLDVQIAQRDTQATADALGLTRATGFINVFDAGYADKSTTGSPRERGYAISLELPIFDWGAARTARAEALYMEAVHRTAAAAIRARSEVRQAYAAYRTNYDLAVHYRDEVVPLRKSISDEMLLRYNGMLASTFELLADARDQMVSVNAAINAQRDFWIADTTLQAVIGGGPAKSQMSTAQ
jgi:outer membrane protein TolC